MLLYVDISCEPGTQQDLGGAKQCPATSTSRINPYWEIVVRKDPMADPFADSGDDLLK